MNRFWLIIIFAAITLTVYGRSLTVHDIPVTRDLTGAEPPTRQEYITQFPVSEMILYNVERAELRRDEDGTVVIVINHRLLGEHEEGFQQYFDDLSEEGYDVVTVDMEGGTPQELKDVVIQEGGDNLVGTVMAGELPLAWFELFEYFDEGEEPDNPRLHEFPVDLFFMDIDGEWQDTSGNEIYDVHEGSWQPDIWFGRMPGYNLNQIDEDELITAYLDKVHRYRTGEMEMPHTSLNFVDDDWTEWADEWGDNMRLAYGGLLEEAQPETTSASRYTYHLNEEAYEMVQVCVHSGADTHLFRINDNSEYDYFRYSQLRDEVAPNVMFYNLFACNAMNLSRDRCLGALYALGGEFGLGAVGSAKTGGMLYFDDYYSRLGDGLCFGEALRLWLAENLIEEGYENWSKSWFYGMTHFGDPTLKIRRGLRVSSINFNDSEAGDDDIIADAGETGIMLLRIINQGESDITNIEIVCSSDDPYLELEDAEGFIEQLSVDEDVQLEVGLAHIANDAPNGYVAHVNVTMTPAEGDPWTDRRGIRLHSPNYLLQYFWISGWFTPGEIGTIPSMTFSNIGGDLQHQEATLNSISLDGLVEPLNENLPLHQHGQVFLSARAQQFSVSEAADINGGVFIHNTITINGVERGSNIFTVPTSDRYIMDERFSEAPVWINHYPVTPGHADVWRWGEAAGDNSGGIAFGAPDSGLYPARSDAAFELPVNNITVQTIEFRHRMSVEEGYDGGILERRIGNDWERFSDFNREGRYNGTSVDNGNFDGGECWNGTFDWTEVRIDIDDDWQDGPYHFRFRFSSDPGIEGEGWFIDNIRINGWPSGIQDLDRGTPSDFELTSTFPNPFNSQIRIDYSLPIASDVSLNVYDLTGREVATLVNSRQAAGMQSVVWNGSDLPSGVYVIRLNGMDQVRNKKVVLIK